MGQSLLMSSNSFDNREASSFPYHERRGKERWRRWEKSRRREKTLGAA